MSNVVVRMYEGEEFEVNLDRRTVKNVRTGGYLRNKERIEAIIASVPSVTEEAEVLPVEIIYADHDHSIQGRRQFHTVAEAVSFLRHWRDKYGSVWVIQAWFEGNELNAEGFTKMIDDERAPVIDCPLTEDDVKPAGTTVEVIKLKRRGNHVMFVVKAGIPSVRTDLDDDSPNKYPNFTIGEVEGHWDVDRFVLETFKPHTWQTVTITDRQYLDIMVAVLESDAAKRAEKSIQKSNRIYEAQLDEANERYKQAERDRMKPDCVTCGDTGVIPGDDGVVQICECKLTGKPKEEVYAVKLNGQWTIGGVNVRSKVLGQTNYVVVPFFSQMDAVAFMNELKVTDYKLE